MTTPASYPAGANQAFGAGVNHVTNPGRSNLGSVTLDGGLQADSARWDAMTPHGVLNTATGTGTPADTNAAVSFGGEAAGNKNDAALAGQSMNHFMMRDAANVGANDNIA